jgi:hypothetical protein
MVRESLIKDRVTTHLNTKHFKVLEEVPFLDKRIDVLGYSSKRRRIIAVEAKVANWQKALEQALTYRLVAEEVYVALWHDNIRRIELDQFKAFGIGVMDVNCRVMTLLDPSKSSIIHRSLRSGVEQYIEQSA